jgi:hypothetical protein
MTIGSVLAHKEGTSFEGWMKQVDHWIEALMGCSVYDLPDQPFRDMYDDGYKPRKAAGIIIAEQMAEGF